MKATISFTVEVDTAMDEQDAIETVRMSINDIPVYPSSEAYMKARVTSATIHTINGRDAALTVGFV